MPLGRFFRSLVDNEVMGEEIVSANVKGYEAAKRLKSHPMSEQNSSTEM